MNYLGVPCVDDCAWSKGIRGLDDFLVKSFLGVSEDFGAILILFLGGETKTQYPKLVSKKETETDGDHECMRLSFL